jgi:putative transposase
MPERPTHGDHCNLDGVFVSIGGRRYYQWRAADQDGDAIDVLFQKRRNVVAAKHFLRKPLEDQKPSRTAS